MTSRHSQFHFYSEAGHYSPAKAIVDEKPGVTFERIDPQSPTG